MDLLTRLPLECLQHILESLHRQEDLASLAALLRTNKYLAAISLPYLYTEPFRPSFLGGKRNVGSSAPQDPSIFAGKLTRQLLCHSIFGRSSSLSSSGRPKALILTFNLDNSDEIGCTKSPLNYFAYIRDLCVERWTTGPHRTWDNQDPSPEILAYIHTDEFKSQCHRDRLCPRYAQRFHPEKQLLLHYFRVTLIRETNWALASPILGQLRTLTIPVSDLDRYLGAVDQLASLEHVWFRIDEAFDFENIYVRTQNTNDATPETVEFTRKNKERKDAVMKDVVRFVREHCRHFPGGVLKTARFSDAGLWPWIRHSVPEEIQFEIFQLLPPLHRPTKLAPPNWLQFTAHPLTTDLRHVKGIEYKKTVSGSFERLRESHLFLQNCRTLNVLIIPSLGQGSFAWAVQEKLDLDKLNLNISGQRQGHRQETTAVSLSSSSGRPAHVQYGLVPLETVEIREFREPFTDEVDDIAFAFSQTLKHLKADASSFVVAQQPQQQPRSIYFGRGWVHLPVLTQLSLNAKNARLIIDQQLFVHCPNVSIVTLTDETHQYQCQDLLQHQHQQLYQPVSLAQLKTITLVGWPALMFHPDILHTTPNITYLSILTYQRSDDYYIPPVGELNQSFGIQPSIVDYGIGAGATIVRPHWSWDWHLPHLKTLKLTSEFAYRFQFRMLVGCPALDVLDLNISTQSRRHTRFLTISELYYQPTTISIENSDNNERSQQPQQKERVIAPLLRTLSLVGPWKITDNNLSGFLTETFPNLTYLTEGGWGGGVTVAGLVRWIRASPQKENLLQVDLTLPEPCFSEKRQDLGMVPGFGVPSGMTLPVTIYFAEMQYVLLVNP
ncbi:hypothetical protein EC991_009248 [Linnemannia zychae]|nr:hypothetical protein EC991_009248 [Linnemannia zychae]